MSTKTEFIVICQSAWMNESGYGIGYDWDCQRFTTRKAAIKHGWKVRGSDDFNVGVVAGDSLVSFDWMHEPAGEDEATMAEIAGAIGLIFSPALAKAEAQP